MHKDAPENAICGDCYPAKVMVHWPSGPIAACGKHASGLKSMGEMLGSHIAITHLEKPAGCFNCKNEMKGGKENGTNK